MGQVKHKFHLRGRKKGHISPSGIFLLKMCNLNLIMKKNIRQNQIEVHSTKELTYNTQNLSVMKVKAQKLFQIEKN